MPVERRSKPRPKKLIKVRGSWKTNTAGLVTILGSLGIAIGQYLSGHEVDVQAVAVGVTAGIGLLSARDDKVPDEEAGAK